MDLVQEITTALAPYGLNLVAATSVGAYESLVPPAYALSPLLTEAKSVIVIGNGGGNFWRGFQSYCAQHPGFRETREHPLDDYTVECTEHSVTPRLERSGGSHCMVYPFQFDNGPQVSFMHLAQAAGLAVPSILGILIHPAYGPWIALRAAVVTDQELPTEVLTTRFDPCPTCTERPCLPTCPAQAIHAETGWDIPACTRHRIGTPTDCVDRCHARYQCVYGREHRYPPDALSYHQARAFAMMRAYAARREPRARGRDRRVC